MNRGSAAMNASSPRRVLYVVSLFPCWSETFIVREIHALIDQGVDIRILSLKPPQESMVQPQAATLLGRVLYPSGSWRTLRAACGIVLVRPVLSLRFVAMMVYELWRRPAALGKSLLAVARGLGCIDEIRAFEPQLLHAPWATYPATVAWFLSQLLQRPFSFTSRAHDIFVEDHMMARKLEHAALAVTITEHNVRYMARWMAAPGTVPVRVIHSALDLAELSLVRTGRRPGHLLSVGRLDPIKGFDILLPALARLHARGVDFTCTVIGEGDERARLEHLSTELGLDSVVSFPGAMPHDVVMQQMDKATLMVLPCVVTQDGNSDGIPNVLMEAMATGLPVISTRISGIPELVEDGVNGRLVPAGDADALADAMHELLDNPQQRATFAAAGRLKVERDFNVRVEAGRLLEHFGTVCHVERRRVLLVIDEMEVGGSQRQAVHLLTGLDRNRWAPELAYFRKTSFLVDSLENAGIPVHHLAKRGRLDPTFLLRFARLIVRGRYDVVHAFSLAAELWTLLALMTLRHPPRLVASIRCLFPDWSGWYWWLKRLVVAHSAAVIANARAGALSAAHRMGLAPELFDVIGNGTEIPTSMPVEARQSLRTAIGAPAGRVLGLFVGRLVPQKNLSCLVDALAAMPVRGRPWIAVAGDGHIRAEIEAKAAGAGVALDLCFLGERSDALLLMQAADFLVLPSHDEGLSNVLLEAMAAGCPVIASDVGGTAELVEHERTGLLFPANDSLALSQCLARLSADATLRQRLSSQAHEHVERAYGITALVDATVAVYERCLLEKTYDASRAAPPDKSSISTRADAA